MSDERGAALVTALLIVAVMASVSVGLVDMSRSVLLRTGVMDERIQASAYATGAQDFVEILLVRAAGREGEALHPDGPWNGQARVFEIEGGRLAGQVRDRNNCLNLNALHADPRDGGAEAAERARARLRSLLRALAVPAGEAEALIAQAADWIDPDTEPRHGGAEDDEYLRRALPHRAANQPFVEIEELRALPVMTPALYSALRPLVCVLPEPVQPPLDVNTLRIEDALLLVVTMEGELSPTDAQSVLFRRPSGGYAQLADFWADPAMAALDPAARREEAVTLRSHWFEVSVTVELERARIERRQTIRLLPDGRIERFAPQQGTVL